MTDPEDIADATCQVEQAHRLIREAQLARKLTEPLIPASKTRSMARAGLAT